MNIKHPKVPVIAAALVLASSSAHAEIELGKGFSVSGFIDMSFVSTDTDGASSTDNVFAVDQVETNFMYKGSDGVSAQVDVEYGESGDGASTDTDETFIEQAFITKQITDALSVKAGRFLSYSGWETEEPTGLFQYSGTGYAPIFYGFYQQGISAYYDAGVVDVAISVVNDAFANPVESDTSQLGTELMVAVAPIEGLTAKLFYITENSTPDGLEKEAINFWTSYSFDEFTFAFEYNTAEDTTGTAGDESDGYLLMANYAAGDYGITLRYHAYETENAAGATVTDISAITIAPSMTVGDNLLLVAEYRMDSNDTMSGSPGADTDTFALEALFTF